MTTARTVVTKSTPANQPATPAGPRIVEPLIKRRIALSQNVVRLALLIHRRLRMLIETFIEADCRGPVNRVENQRMA